MSFPRRLLILFLLLLRDTTSFYSHEVDTFIRQFLPESEQWKTSVSSRKRRKIFNA